MALPGPFPEKPAKDTLFESQLLFDWLKPLYQDARYSMSNFAVMYLTPGRAAYAGWNLDKPRYSGSVLKIAALYAAYELRTNAKLAAPGMKADVVLRDIEAAWKPIVQKAVAGPPNFPKLAEIFTPYTSTVEFRNDFHDDLKLMASKSARRHRAASSPSLGISTSTASWRGRNCLRKRRKAFGWVVTTTTSNGIPSLKASPTTRRRRGPSCAS